MASFIATATELLDRNVASEAEYEVWESDYGGLWNGVWLYFEQHLSSADAVRFRCVNREGASINYLKAWGGRRGGHNSRLNDLVVCLSFVGIYSIGTSRKRTDYSSLHRNQGKVAVESTFIRLHTVIQFKERWPLSCEKHGSTAVRCL